MKELSIENLKEAAKQIFIDVPENEYKLLVAEFKEILTPLFLINDNELNYFEPMDFPFKIDVDESFLRDDVVDDIVNRDDFIRNSKYKVAGQIKFPKNN